MDQRFSQLKEYYVDILLVDKCLGSKKNVSFPQKAGIFTRKVNELP